MMDFRGPWHIDERLTDHCDHPVIVDADGVQLASTSQDDGLDGEPLALLIAAAPELLAMLERVVRHYEPADGIKEGCDCSPCEALRLIRRVKGKL